MPYNIDGLMMQHDFKSPRLFVDAPLNVGSRIALEREQGHYLGNVLRLGAGDSILVFNGHDGEWRAHIEGRKRLEHLILTEQIRPQETPCDLHLLFAPLKHARLDYMVQKAVEMGASLLAPTLTQFTQVSRVNTARMRANAIEAAEQCGILNLPEINEPQPLTRRLTERDGQRLLIFCDEAAPLADPLKALSANKPGGLDVLIGPEGGFSEEERTLLLRQPRLMRLSLGPRILRADTAAVVALALVQAALGDWGDPNRPDSR